MDMVRFGRGLRALRLRRRWRQADLAAAARVSQSTVARIEQGLGGRMPTETLTKAAHALGARIDIRLNWAGEGLDRLLDQEHASLVEAFARRLRAASWEVHTEVTFWIRGERGAVDLLAWHPESQIILVVEIKSVVPDVQAMLATLDRKARLGLEIAASVGRHGAVVGRLLVVGESRTARRRVETHQATFQAALPDRFVEVRRFLAAPWPEPALRGLVFLPGSHRLTTRHRQSGRGVSRERGSSIDDARIPPSKSPGDQVTRQRRRAVSA